MIEVAPNYYRKFNCIADKCKHSCCIGWEIDIDEETMDFYNLLDTKLGERIRENIDGSVPHFVLTDGERCPFLNKNGLCDIICEYGEDALCDICFLHPRFKNFYSSFTEIGLGLCCEEAARVILTQKEKFFVELPDDIELTDGEKEYFSKRQEIFDLLQDREKSVSERLRELSNEFGFDFDFSLNELVKFYLSLERLDEKWTEELNKLNGFVFDCEIFDDNDFLVPFEQLAIYFIFRHMDEAMYDGDYSKIVKFSLMSCYLIGALTSRYLKEKSSIKLNKMIDFARMYSSEVEYSENNIQKLTR